MDMQNVIMARNSVWEENVGW